MRSLGIFVFVAVSLAFAAPAGAGVAFDPPANYPTDDQPAATVAGAFDTIAASDLATATIGGKNVDTLLDIGNGGFNFGPTYDLGSAARALAAGDLDNDGLDDLVAGRGQGASVFLAHSTGRFTAAPSIDVAGLTTLGVGFFNA